MPSKKAFGADNQQERLKFMGWIVGFVDKDYTFLREKSFTNGKEKRFSYFRKDCKDDE